MTNRQSATVEQVQASIRASLARRRSIGIPYQHYLVDELFPAEVAKELAELPFEAPSLDGISGTREIHNASRQYFDPSVQESYPVAGRVAEAFQSHEVCQELASTLSAPIDRTLLRLEYALDVNGFWLAPHTDLGVKKLTCLIFLSPDPEHAGLGTDIYASRTEHVGCVPFRANTAMCFVPGPDTWHGFERRPISGVRRSLIVNYVTGDWRAREQLAFPSKPVSLTPV